MVCSTRNKTTLINAKSTLTRLASQTSYNSIFILDRSQEYLLRNASRSRQTPTSLSGLCYMTPSPRTLFQCACAPGTLAEDDAAEKRSSFFTKHLFKHIATPNKHAYSVLQDVNSDIYIESGTRQIPCIVSTIVIIDEDTYLNRHSPNQTPT